MTERNSNLFLGRSMWILFAFSGLVMAISAKGEIIPADRMAPWQGNVGVVGGIPDSSTMTVYTTVPAGASAAMINSAIAACPSNQVVQLSPGTFNLSSRIVGKSGVVLRGAGMAATVLAPTHGDYGGAIYVGRNYFWRAIYQGDYNGGGTANWTAGYAKGTSNLTFSSTSGLTVGNIVILDQLNDDFYANPNGYEGNNGAGRGNGARALEQFSRVTAINGNTVTISPPVVLPFWSGSLSPQAVWVGENSWTRRFGIEDMTIDGTGLSGGDPYRANIFFETAENCWIKNVKSLKPTVSHVCFYGAMNCEIRHSYFYDTKSAASLSYGITPQFSAWMLIEDNILEKITAPILIGSDAHCSVIGYNYATNMYYSQANNFLMAAFQAHDAHNYMWLMEGNYIGSKVTGDFIHGSSSHNVLFRNRITGYEANTYPSGPSVNNMHCILLDIKTRAWSSVGNILGTSGVYVNYESIPSAHASEPVIYSLGVENTAYGKNWGDDSSTYSTFYRHMDYDTVTRGIRYNPTNTDVALPNSLYYASKPAGFGSLPWPPYNPSNPSEASADDIPAGYRYLHGTDPPDGGTPVTGSPSAPTPTPAVTIGVGGLVAAYAFEEGSGGATADASGNNNNGTINGAAWTSAGRYGSALSFNGTNSLVTVNKSTSLDLTSGLSLEAWVYPRALGGWKSVLFKAQGTQGLSYVLQGSSGAAAVPSLGLSVAASNLMAPSPLPLNTWSHLAATYDGARMVLYVNGTQVASRAQTGQISSSTDPLTIGGNSGGENFSGSIDEVRIYNRALSASEIQADMTTPVGTQPPAAPTGLDIVGQ